MLHRRGIWRVRPLAGGLEEWRRRGYPLEIRGGDVPIASEAPSSLSVS